MSVDFASIADLINFFASFLTFGSEGGSTGV
ncbi:hypothetical protein SAMN04490239_3469 [Rhodococcus koreensis]|uniref:Uncharacterized protein n=1 Tax=Rhodococcus koreensis TaxID=99653 RepID=A0A1H4R436_9NOCA|nr:hypothetical protein SAMN04490239_3469 [Rhodococcus koreensis]